MPGSVSRLPDGPAGGDGMIPPLEIYKAALDEYRFQVLFNWSRTQYMLVFNTAVLAAATVVAGHAGRAACLVFALGVVACGVAFLVMRTQHDYYRAARDRMRRIEIAVGVPVEQRLDTTSTLGGRRRTASVTQLVYLLLAAVAVADATGGVLVLLR